MCHNLTCRKEIPKSVLQGERKLYRLEAQTDLHEEKKHVGEVINQSKMKAFTFLIVNYAKR